MLDSDNYQNVHLIRQNLKLPSVIFSIGFSSLLGLKAKPHFLPWPSQPSLSGPVLFQNFTVCYFLLQLSLLTPFIANTPSTFLPESLLTRALSPALCMKFRFQLKCHLARVAFPTRIANIAPSWEVKFDDTETKEKTPLMTKHP